MTCDWSNPALSSASWIAPAARRKAAFGSLLSASVSFRQACSESRSSPTLPTATWISCPVMLAPTATPIEELSAIVDGGRPARPDSGLTSSVKARPRSRRSDTRLETVALERPVRSMSSSLLRAPFLRSSSTTRRRFLEPPPFKSVELTRVTCPRSTRTANSEEHWSKTPC